MNFLVDAQLPPALAHWIASRGHGATHVFDLGLHTTDDPTIWERARSQGLWPDAVIRLERGEKLVELRG